MSARRLFAARVVGTALLTEAVAAGCYRYAPIQESAVRPEEEVRVRLTPGAGARLVPELGAYRTMIEGQFARQSADTVSVSVAIAREYQGAALEATRQSFFLGRSEVVAVERREFSQRRTALAGIGALAAFGALIGTIKQLTTPNPDPGEPLPPPPPPGARPTGQIGLFRLLFR